jgi:hypothetical protein
VKPEKGKNHAKLQKSPLLDFFDSLAIFQKLENPKIEMISEDYCHKVR